MYIFVLNSPSNYIDPYGHQFLPPSQHQKMKKIILDPIEKSWRSIWGDDICPIVKKCRKICFKAFMGHYETKNDRYAGNATKWFVKQLLRFTSSAVAPITMLVGEIFTYRLVCAILCNDKDMASSFNTLE